MDFRTMTPQQMTTATLRVVMALETSGAVLEPYYRVHDGKYPVIYGRVFVRGLGWVPVTFRTDTIERLAEQLEKE